MGVMPASTLHARLIAMGRTARAGVSGHAWFGVVPGIGIATTLLMLPLVFLGGFGAATSLGDPVFGMLAAMLVGLLAGGIGGYYLLNLLLMQRFEASYASITRRMTETQLPLLVADEDFTAGILAMVKENASFMFTGPPRCRSLDDQLSLSACYVNLLSIFQFAASNERAPMWKQGNDGFFSTTHAARVINAIGSFGGCVPYIGCVGYILLPWAIRNLLRAAEQRGALCAICAYFSDDPRRVASAQNQQGWGSTEQGKQ
jgi:hypothetical protein